MEVAGNFHDVGKLVIPSSILDKPGPLTIDEMAVMKSHTYYTYSILKTIGGIENLAEWAALPPREARRVELSPSTAPDRA